MDESVDELVLSNEVSGAESLNGTLIEVDKSDDTRSQIQLGEAARLRRSSSCQSKATGIGP